MRVSAAGPAFFPVFAALHRGCFTRSWDEAAFAGLFDTPGTFGLIAASEEGAPVGLCLYRVVADQAEILTIGVLPEARGSGAARALLAEAGADAAARGAMRLFLEVSVNNAAARRLYAAAGFSAIGLRKNYYKEQVDGAMIPVDAEILAKNLG
jgi:[ribosomal protein S18]-alanine N-acetyltransferase